MSIAKDLARRRLLSALSDVVKSCRSNATAHVFRHPLVTLCGRTDTPGRSDCVERESSSTSPLDASDSSKCTSSFLPILLCPLPRTIRRSFDSKSGLHDRDTDAKASSAMGSSIKSAEVLKFDEMAKDWWDPEGSSAPLHSLNPIRTRFTRDALCLCFGRERSTAQPLQGLTILDVGCGGGLFSEALARLGARVTGIDASEMAILVAREHAHADPIIHERTSYRNITAEQAVAEGLQFDAVVASEVIEHVGNVPEFCRSLAALTKDSGAVVISTINRTASSYTVAILGAEYVAQIVPKGTHDWSCFITPDELTRLMEGVGLPQVSISGMFLNPLTGRWSLTNDTAVNYIVLFTKRDRIQASGSGKT